MSRTVYTYKSIENLRSHPAFDEIASCPNIVATTNMQYAVTKYYDEIKYVKNIYPLQAAVVDDWLDNSVILGQHMSLSTVLNQATGVPANEKNIWEAFAKCRKDVLSAIRSLVEAEAYPDDINPTCAEERIFKAVWSKVEEVNPSFGRFRARLDRCWSDDQFFNDVISKFGAVIKSKTIVLHGFYYITAVQERIFDLLEKRGKNLVFLSCIDPSIPEVEQIWLSNFKEENGFQNQKVWTGCDNANGPAHAFGEIFSGVQASAVLNNVRIIKYENEAAFLEDVKRVDHDGFSIYSTDAKKTEAVLKEIFPEKFKKRHLLAYPVGRFFYVLHSMWDKRAQRLKITLSDLQACFASGWLVSGNCNGRDHTHSLELLAPYFSDCDSISSWEKRMQKYRQVSAEIKGMFEKHISELPAEHALSHRVMSDPFLNFGCFSLDPKEAETVFRLIHSLIETAQKLFGSGSEINIESHFEKIREIIAQGAGNASLYEEESAIVAELAERMKSPHFEAASCLPEDISEAVMMIIGGGILDEDSFEVLSSSDEHFVRSMFQIETAPIVAEGRVHLCFADENRLPGLKSRYPWPLSSSFLSRLLAGIPGRRAQYLKDLIYVTESTQSANRYLFYSALQNQKVELSWIAEENGKIVGESPYIRILNSVFCCPIEEYRRCGIDDAAIKGGGKAKTEEITVFTENLPIMEERIDVALCPWKYIYGYLANEFPSYQDDFHYRFVLSALIGTFSKASGCSIEKTAECVLECFPYLKPVEKRQTRDFASRTFPVEGEDSLDDASYTRLRLIPHLLSKPLVAQAFCELDTGSGKAMKIDMISCEGDSYDVCLYCQFSGDCIHAVREKRNDG